MLTESRSAFLLVRNDACLTRAKEDLRVSQSFLRRRSPASGIETVQSIWTTLAARFIPIFPADAPDASVSAELQILEARYPGLVRPPIYQDASGRLILPSAPPHNQAAAS